ncbi:sialidase family protein [Massilia sp. YMA4]|uniref:sialidase family protein n=1 Tax=Massilia sp. YMA4 TaxID=1593482 RepID=UPI0015844054|nr:sialidase family protein [Massilia sp. YMA4]
MTLPSLRGAARLLALSATAALTGCTTMATDPAKTGPVAGQVPVILSITSNTGQVRGTDLIHLDRFDTPGAATAAAGSQSYTLRRVAAGIGRDTAAFVGNLPPGEYELTQFLDLGTHKSLRLGDSQRAALGRFTVAGSTAVDLGRVIITPLNEKVLVGQSTSLPSNRALLPRLPADYARLFAGTAGQAWSVAPEAALPVERYALNRPVGADCVTELADGRVVAASRLGALLVRATDGRWSALRGPSLESLLCVSPVALPDADLLAVGEYGTLLRHAPNGDKLIPVDTGNLPPGDLVRIEGSAGAGWYVAHRDGSALTIFRSDRLEAGDWQVVARESLAFSFWHGGVGFWMWPTKDGFGYSTSAGPLRFLDFATRQWRERALPDNRRLIDIRHSPTGLLSVLTSPGGGMGGIFAKVHTSLDGGEHWTAIESPFKVVISPVTQLANGTMLMYGGAMTQAELQSSTDNGKTWSRLADYQHGQVFHALKSGLLVDADLGQFGIFDLRSSGDGGRHWKIEYTTFDRAFYEQQKARDGNK